MVLIHLVSTNGPHRAVRADADVLGRARHLVPAGAIPAVEAAERLEALGVVATALVEAGFDETKRALVAFLPGAAGGILFRPDDPDRPIGTDADALRRAGHLLPIDRRLVALLGIPSRLGDN